LLCSSLPLLSYDLNRRHHNPAVRAASARQAASGSEPAETLAGVRGDVSSRDCLRTIGPCGPMDEHFMGHPES